MHKFLSLSIEEEFAAFLFKMAKKHKGIIHNAEKTRHERSECSSFYGSLVVIMFLIVATAMLLTKDESFDLTGMAVAFR